MLATVPGGSATTTDIAWNAAEVRLREDGVARPLIWAVVAPERRAERALEAGDPGDRRRAARRGRASRPIGCSHWSPIAFQYSSSWSSNPFIAPSTR